MHDRNSLHTAAAPVGADDRMRSLRRMRQLADEIAGALAADRLDVVKRACRLLLPTLEQYRQTGASLRPTGEAREIVRQTIDILNRCESTLEGSMITVQRDLKRLLAGRRIVVRSRISPQYTSGRRLDISQ